jgi:hypothetical protein
VLQVNNLALHSAKGRNVKIIGVLSEKRQLRKGTTCLSFH